MRIAALFGLFAAIVLIAFWSSRRRRPRELAERPAVPELTNDDAASPAAIAYSTDTTDNITAECYKIAFDVSRFDYRIFDEHAAVLALVERDAEASVHQRDYFPRRPLLLPKLLQ